MEISGNNPLIGLNKNVQRLDSPQQSGDIQKRGATSSDSDRLDLSVRSLEISHLEDLIRATPDVREDRVNQVRSQIESGAYNVKAEQIADKIIGGNLLDEVG
jgi:negative regulator of flagellin synthesis FlgM